MRTFTQKFRWIGVSAIAISIGLSGCAQTINGLASNQGQHGINPDTVQQPNHPPNSTFEEMLPGSFFTDPIDPAKPANDLRGNAPHDQNNSQTGDTTNPQPGKPTNPQRDTATTCSNQENTFCNLQSQSSAQDANKSIAKKYLLMGITLSNELCDVWFNKLYTTQITFKQSSDIMSAAGSLTTAILGYSGADSRTSGLAASIFGVGKQTLDSLVTNYVIAPDLTSVAVAVREYRSLYAAKLESAQTEWNYYTARRAIMAYDNSCSALSVKRFINARISGTQPEESPQPLLELATSKLLVEWKGKFEVPVNTVSDLVDLYAYMTVSNDLVKDDLKNDAKKLASNLIFFKNNHNLPELVNALRDANITQYINSLVEKKVENIKSKIKARADNVDDLSIISDKYNKILDNNLSEFLSVLKVKLKIDLKTTSELVDLYAYEISSANYSNKFGSLNEEEKAYFKGEAKKISSNLDFYKEKYNFSDITNELQTQNLTEYMNLRVMEKLLQLRDDRGSEAKGMPTSNNGKPVDIAPK